MYYVDIHRPFTIHDYRSDIRTVNSDRLIFYLIHTTSPPTPTPNPGSRDRNARHDDDHTTEKRIQNQSSPPAGGGPRSFMYSVFPSYLFLYLDIVIC